MKELLLLCTKSVQFIFNDEIYIQAIGSPLGPVLANIFMVELKKILIPQVGQRSKAMETVS